MIAYRAGLALLLALTVHAGTVCAQATFANFDAAQFEDNGFRFADFADNFFGNFTIADGLIKLDLTEDVDLANGFFGGAGSDVSAEFESDTTQLEVTFAVGADNVAEDFRVVLADNDGVGIGEEYQYSVGLTDVVPADGFVTKILPLDSFVFRQAGFMQADGDMELNFGLTQIQVQSAFGVADRLQVDIESVKLVDPEAPFNPLVIELTPATFAAQAQSFDFGIFQDAGVVDQAGGTFIIDANQSTTPGGSGGLGFNGLNTDFDAETHEIQVEARLLAGNTAETFNVLLGDSDGTDSGPGEGSEDYIFTVATDEFTETDFSTFTIPLGTGSESAVVTTFGFTNGGDELQNFDLSQLQIQMDAVEDGGTGSGLAIEIARVSIVAIETLDGDFNGDGVVDAADYTVFRDNVGADESVLLGAGDGSGTVDEGDLAVWQGNYGAGTGGVAAAVPEAGSTALLILAASFGAFVGRKARGDS